MLTLKAERKYYMENIINDDWSLLTNKEKRKEYKELAKNRLEETRVMKNGEIAFIIKYNNYKDIIVQFKSTGELIKCTYKSFKKGTLKSHFSPSVYGIGIVGLEQTVDKNGEVMKSYAIWTSMLARCYSTKRQKTQPHYIGCTVCDEWHYYSNFKKFYDDNYYIIEGFRTELDKDILHKGNKIYSPENCVFVPNNINSLFIKGRNMRGDTHIGVALDQRTGMYIARCRDGKTQRQLGIFKTSIEAFNSYKQYKEEFIKKLAEQYKTQIPQKLYEAMINYTVEIDD